MLTNPSTLGVFERRIQEVAKLVHEAGGLLYYDGANLNAILGKVRPGDMGFDVIHMNLHKTFSTPHGGGGPGSGAVGVGERLLPFLPIPIVGKDGDRYRWLDERDVPQTIGRLSAFMGNAGVLLRAYVYMRMLGRAGMQRVAEYRGAECELHARAAEAGGLRCCVSGSAREPRVHHHAQAPGEASSASTRWTSPSGCSIYGFHAPTTYFPLLVPECLLIEPTETEAKEELDGFVEAMVAIQREAEQDAAKVKGAPYTLPVRRLDDVRAAKQLDLTYQQRRRNSG